jgi:hypothetical protein
MTRRSGKRTRIRFQFSILTLLLLATVLGPLLGWYGPVAVARVQFWLAKDEPAPVNAIFAPPLPMNRLSVKPTPMIGPIPVDIEMGMKADADQRRARVMKRGIK